VHRFDAGVEKLPLAARRGSTHCFNPADAIELGRTLERLPPRLIFYGIEAKCVEPGSPISRAVRHAIPEIVRRVWEELLIPPVRE
jgi:hydrogenase maturation protease